MTDYDFILQLGGTAEAAKIFDTSKQVIRLWVHRGFPASRHLQAWKVAVRHGLPWKPPGYSDFTLTQTGGTKL